MKEAEKSQNILAELFINTGSGFNQKESIQINTSLGDQILEFDISSFTNIESIRFDPAPEKCIVKNIQVIINHIDEADEEVTFSNSASWLDNGYYFFLDDEPKVFIRKDLATTVIQYVTIKIKYVFVNQLILGLFGAQLEKHRRGVPEVRKSFKSIDKQLSDLNAGLLSRLEAKENDYNYLLREYENLQKESKAEVAGMNLKIRSALNDRFSSQQKFTNLADEYASYKMGMKDSLSYKLGFGLTAPLRYLSDRFGKKSNKVLELKVGEKVDPYDIWIKNNTLTDSLRVFIKNKANSFSYRPKVSIVVPVYNVEKIWLEKLVVSIKRQLYDNWELCFADDNSSSAHIKPLLKKLAGSDKRIKVVYRDKNGMISAATNSALEVATGEFIAFMDNDDELHELALYEIVKLLNEDDKVDIIYTDEDKMDEEGKRFNPHFKPGWSPEFLLSYNYINHLLCVRKTLVDEVGGLRSEYDGTQDYDFILRIIRKSSRVKHIPKVLYHWRALSTSIAGDGASKTASLKFFEKGRKSLQHYLDEKQIKAEVVQPDFAVANNLGMYEVRWPDEGERVSIVVKSNASSKSLLRLLISIDKTKYRNFEVHLILDEPSDIDKSRLGYEVKEHIVLGENAPRAYNQIVDKLSTPYVLFLDRTLEVNDETWLSQLSGLLSLHNVAMVYPKLFQSNEKVYLAGVADGIYAGSVDNLPYYSFKNAPPTALGYFFYINSTRNYSLAPRECFMTKVAVFKHLGGFDEETFAEDFYSYDYSNRLTETGRRIAYTGTTSLQYQSSVRKKLLNPKEAYHYKNKFDSNGLDPHYNVNFSKTIYLGVNPDNTSGMHVDIKSKPKVLFVSQNLNFEGAPLQIKEIMEGLQKKYDYEFHVFSPQEGPLREEFEKSGINVSVRELEVTTLKEYNTGVKSLQSWIKSEGFDLVYANTLMTFYAIDALKELSIPSVWIIHESYDIHTFYKYLNGDIKTKAINCFKYVDKVLFVAKATMNMFQHFNYTGGFEVINNALKTTAESRFPITRRIEARKKLNIDENAVVFLNLGSVCERKGQLDYAVAAVNYINAEKVTDALFVIVGGRDDEYMHEIEDVIRNGDCEEHFMIVMETGEVEQYYLASDVFVCSSYIESYPRVILEAMNYNLPIISTNVFGIKEQIVDGVNGEFYVPGETMVLTDKISKFKRSKELRDKYADNGYYMLRIINSYDQMLEKYHRVNMNIYMANFQQKINAV